MASTEPKSTSGTLAPSTTTVSTPSYRLPSDLTLQNASKISMTEDKPIMLDYWTSSLDRKSAVGVRANGEKLLVKSAEEYTSPICKLYRVGEDLIVVTENSIPLQTTTSWHLDKDPAVFPLSRITISTSFATFGFCAARTRQSRSLISFSGDALTIGRL